MERMADIILQKSNDLIFRAGQCQLPTARAAPENIAQNLLIHIHNR
jgi:hypothetical protein